MLSANRAVRVPAHRACCIKSQYITRSLAQTHTSALDARPMSARNGQSASFITLAHAALARAPDATIPTGRSRGRRRRTLRRHPRSQPQPENRVGWAGCRMSVHFPFELHTNTHTQEIINNVCEHTHTAKNCSRKFRCLRFFLCAWTNCRRSTCAHVHTCSFAHRPARKVRVRSSVRACVRARGWFGRRKPPTACRLPHAQTRMHTHKHRPRAPPPKLQAEPGLAHPRRNISYMHTHSHSHTHNARLSNTHIPFASL